jgi:hypothetical protein
MSRKETSRVYQHIDECGWSNVKIVLIEEVTCENREQLRKRENEILSLYREEPFCLNVYSAYQTADERRTYLTEYNKKYYTENREKRLEYAKKYRQENKNVLTEYFKQYREINKERMSERDRQYRLRKRAEV